MRIAIKTSQINKIKILLDYSIFINKSEIKNKIDEDLNNGLSISDTIINFLKNPIISKCLAANIDEEKYISDMISNIKEE